MPQRRRGWCSLAFHIPRPNDATQDCGFVCNNIVEANISPDFANTIPQLGHRMHAMKWVLTAVKGRSVGKVTLVGRLVVPMGSHSSEAEHDMAIVRFSAGHVSVDGHICICFVEVAAHWRQHSSDKCNLAIRPLRLYTVCCQWRFSASLRRLPIGFNSQPTGVSLVPHPACMNGHAARERDTHTPATISHTHLDGKYHQAQSINMSTVTNMVSVSVYRRFTM